MLVDRRFPFRNKQDRSSRDEEDRFKFDRDSDDEEDEDSLFDGSFMGQSTRQSNERSLLIARSTADTQAANARRLGSQPEQASAGNAPPQPQQAQIAGGGS